MGDLYAVASAPTLGALSELTFGRTQTLLHGVDAPTPTARFRLGRELIEAAKSVWIELPVAATQRDVDELIAATTAGTATVCAGAWLLFAPAVAQLRAALPKPEQVQHCSVRFAIPQSPMLSMTQHRLAMTCQALAVALAINPQRVATRCDAKSDGNLTLVFEDGALTSIEVPHEVGAVELVVQVAAPDFVVRADISVNDRNELHSTVEQTGERTASLVSPTASPLTHLGLDANITSFVDAATGRGSAVVPLGFAGLITKLLAPTGMLDE